MSVTHIAKVSSAIKKMDNNWRDKKLALQIKRFYSQDNPPLQCRDLANVTG